MEKRIKKAHGRRIKRKKMIKNDKENEESWETRNKIKSEKEKRRKENKKISL